MLTVETGAPLLSVVIPSHYRAESLERVVAALSLHAEANRDFEVVVVLDGACERSSRMLASWQEALPLRWYAQPAKGATAARNRGLADARGQFVLFLDDDVIPGPELLRAHLAAHAEGDPCLVFGTFRRSSGSPEPLVQEAVDWSTLHSARCTAPGSKPEPRMVADGNLSARRDLLIRIGGWDERLTGVGGSDDTDLAERWLRQGLSLHFAPEAVGEHYWTKSWAEYVRDRRQIGRAHRYLSSKHPGIAAELDIARYTSKGWHRRLLRASVRVLPSLCFSLAYRLVSQVPAGWNARAGRPLWRFAIALSGAAFYLRGFEEGEKAIPGIQQARGQTKSTASQVSAR